MQPNGPKHIVAAGLLVTRGDRVLLVRTPRRGWEFPGGQIEEGESLLDGVLREVAEEANVQATADYLVGVYSNLSFSRVIFDFLGSWISGEAKTGEETMDVCWAQKREAGEMIEHPGYSRRLKQLLEFDGRVLYQSYTSNPFTVHTERLV